MSVTVANHSLSDRALEVLRRAGNPFRNYFARNPDDDVCARYHVPELFAREREQLLGVVDLYRYDPSIHSEIVPVLGNKGSGKTHLLHSIKHGNEGGWQLLVTPGTYQKDTDFLEYLLFQVIDTLLGGGKQKGARPLEFVGEELSRRLLQRALSALTTDQMLDLFPAPGLGRWARRLGLGSGQAQERTQWLIDNLNTPFANLMQGGLFNNVSGCLKRICTECNLDPALACEIVCRHIEQVEPLNTTGLMRRSIHQGFVRSALLGDESDLANFLTFGFAELDFKVQPSRQDLVLALFKVLMEIFLHLRIPVVVAFDQLEDLLLARRSDDCHRVAETFFAGIVQVMHQIDGVCFLVFAERGLWNRFVPSLDGYIQDRLNNPVHVPGYGTIKALRLEAPAPELLHRIVEARMLPSLEELPDFDQISEIYPFTEEQIVQIARTEPTLRDMLQQFRHLFDHLIYGEGNTDAVGKNNGGFLDSQESSNRLPMNENMPRVKSIAFVDGNSDQPQYGDSQSSNGMPPVPTPAPTFLNQPPVFLDQSAQDSASSTANDMPSATPVSSNSMIGEGNFTDHALELWEQEMRAARRKLEPEGALTGATRELQAGLGSFLQICHEHGVKVGPWRLQHVVGELTFGEHPTYGVFTIAHWVCKDGQPWKVGIGLFMARGAGKPRDLEMKLQSLDMTPPVIDHLILLRPDDDVSFTGKSKTLWQDCMKKGQSARLEPVDIEGFCSLYAFPRWLSAVEEAMPEGQPLPNLADLIQDQCEKILEQVCMPVSA